MLGLQHFSLSKGFAPTGVARASLKARSRGFEGSGLGWTHLILSGVRSLVPPNWSRADRVTVVVKSEAFSLPADLRVIENEVVYGLVRRVIIEKERVPPYSRAD